VSPAVSRQCPALGRTERGSGFETERCLTCLPAERLLQQGCRLALPGLRPVIALATQLQLRFPGQSLKGLIVKTHYDPFKHSQAPLQGCRAMTRIRGRSGRLVWIDSSPLVIGAAEAGMPRRWLGEAKTEPDGIPAEARPMPHRSPGPFQLPRLNHDNRTSDGADPRRSQCPGLV
jgi:hypothetical protein